MTDGPKVGDVYRYKPERTHCREGMALAVFSRGNNKVVLRDTYWNAHPESIDDHILTEDELQTAEYSFNAGDYGVVEKEEWLDFHPDDRAAIRSQHGLRVVYLVRRGSSRSLQTQIENAEYEVEVAKKDLASAERWLQCRVERLAELKAESEA